MARQIGEYKITGTIDEICFYKMRGKYYARVKSSLTGKRVKKDPAFAGTMRYAGLLAQASKIASAVYRQLAPEQKEKGLYKKMTGQAMQLLKEGNCPESTKLRLEGSYISPSPKVPEVAYEIQLPQHHLLTSEAEKKTSTTNNTETRYAFADDLLKSIFGEETVLTFANNYVLIENNGPT